MFHNRVDPLETGDDIHRSHHYIGKELEDISERKSLIFLLIWVAIAIIANITLIVMSWYENVKTKDIEKE